MPRAKDAPENVGGQISPYVQSSLQQNKQQAESRLVAAMQEAGATQRTAMSERGAGERASLQAGTQRSIEASRAESADKRAAEDEVARREDRKFATTMSEASQKFQGKQAELTRDFQIARQEGDWDRTDELEKKRDAFRRVDNRIRLQASKDNINAIMSMAKGMGNLELLKEKVNTTMLEETNTFDKHKKIYNTTIETVVEAAEFNKKMDLPVKGKFKSQYTGYTGPFGGGLVPITPEFLPGTQADPMGFLQDQINKHGGAISIENLSIANIHKVVEQIQAGEVGPEDINKTFGALGGVLEVVGEKRKEFGRDRKSDEFVFWQNTYLEIDQFVDNLEGLINKTDLKIKGSETETVGSKMEYALGTIHDRSIGGQGARFKELNAGILEGFLDEMTKSVQRPQLESIEFGMNEYEIQIIKDNNADLISVYPELDPEISAFESGPDFIGPQLEGDR